MSGNYKKILNEGCKYLNMGMNIIKEGYGEYDYDEQNPADMRPQEMDPEEMPENEGVSTGDLSQTDERITQIRQIALSALAEFTDVDSEGYLFYKKIWLMCDKAVSDKENVGNSNS